MREREMVSTNLFYALPFTILHPFLLFRLKGKRERERERERERMCTHFSLTNERKFLREMKKWG